MVQRSENAVTDRIGLIYSCARAREARALRHELPYGATQRERRDRQDWIELFMTEYAMQEGEHRILWAWPKVSDKSLTVLTEGPSK